MIVEKEKNNLYRIATEEMQISSMTEDGGNVLFDRVSLNILLYDLLIGILPLIG